MNNFYEVLHRSTKSKARLGKIKTRHGVINTPALVPVATKGTLKSLPPQFIEDIGIQTAFVNTYHLVTHPGSEIIKKAGGIHNFTKLDIPLMSDSGGFQVFSLARDNKARRRVFSTASPPKGGSPKRLFQKQAPSLLNYQTRKANIRGEEEPMLVKISDDGVKFRSTFDGRLIEFTPELSMKYQQEIGADINMAFDECTYYPSTHEYAKKAMERTHGWLRRCIRYKKNFQFEIRNLKSNINNLNIKNLLKIKNFKFQINQYLYGVIQGGTYENLRKKSAEFVASQSVDGVAIGGVAVGETKKEMREQVEWVSNYLPKNKPVHLLGIGQFDDILDLVGYGIDTFDCVEPTRLARVGRIYQLNKVRYHFFRPPHPERPRRFAQKRYLHLDYEIDILKGAYKNDLTPVDAGCNCYICTNFTKAYLHHLFKQKEILGYTLATYHNLWVMERFFDRIRKLIVNNQI